VKSVLVVDDAEECRASVRRLVESLGYEVRAVGDGEAALDASSQKKPDLVLLDVSMPGIDGFETARQYRMRVSEQTPIVMLTGLDDMDTRLRSIEAGANDVLTKPARRELVDVRLRTLLEQEEKFARLTSCQQMAFALTKAVETRSKFTSGHARRTGHWAAKMGRELGLPSERVALLQAGGLLHDVGKIGVPENILDKPGALTDDETEIMQGHPRLGELIIKAGRIEPLVAQCVRSHHERMDGRGYPDGVKLGELPFEVRVVQVADVFDALTSNRPYRRASEPDEAVKIIREGVDEGQFCPEASRLLEALVDRGVLVPRRAGAC
jgi:response regulator RpfG family c-di-GMP phosphodiesterase